MQALLIGKALIIFVNPWSWWKGFWSEHRTCSVLDSFRQNNHFQWCFSQMIPCTLHPQWPTTKMWQYHWYIQSCLPTKADLTWIGQGLFSWKTLLTRPEKIHQVHNFDAIFINLYFLKMQYIELYESWENYGLKYLLSPFWNIFHLKRP